MRKKLIISMATISSFVALASVSAFAYFKYEQSKNEISISHNITGGIVNLTSFEDLVEHSKYTKKNDESIKSEISSGTYARKTLQLANNIVLTNNVEITTDCNIDLNGYKLYLNGYNLTFNHAYYGTYQLYSSIVGGVVVPEQVTVENDGSSVTIEALDGGSDGKIIINTPNAVATTNTNVATKRVDNTALTLTDYIKVLDKDDMVLGYNALYMVGESLADYTDKKAVKLDLTSLADSESISLSGEAYTYDSKLFVSTRDLNDESLCTMSDTPHACSFVYKDLDLPCNYLNYNDITIEYESSDETSLTNFGEYVHTGAKKDITLTANVMRSGEVIASSTFNLHVVDPASSAMLDVAETLFYSTVVEHYDSENSIYSFARDIFLPSKFGECKLTYEAFKTSATGEAIVAGSDKKYQSLGDSTISESTDYLYNFSPTGETSLLGVTAKVGTSTRTFYIPVYSSSFVINTEASVARDIINEWYGGRITINKTGGNYNTKTLYSYDDIDHKVYPTVKGLSYSIINDSHDCYDLVDAIGSTRKVITVNRGTTPEAYVDTPILNCKFNINGKEVTIQLPIIVKTGEGSTDTLSTFLPYYTYYDEMMKYTYNYYVSQTFEMPLAYSKTGPIIVYDFAKIPSGYDDDVRLDINPAEAQAFTVKLYYNGEIRITLPYSNGDSYTDKLDAALADAGITLAEILAYGDAKWIFEYNINKVTNSNMELALIYNYKFNPAETAWTEFDVDDSEFQKVTKFTAAGILHYGTDVVDENFYKWIYDNFNINADEDGNKLTYTLGDYAKALVNSSSGKYVVIDWLNQNVPLDASTDDAIDDISNFKGLQFLVGTKYLCLTKADGTGVYALTSSPNYLNPDQEVIELCKEISKMRNLETLILTGCSRITDGIVPWQFKEADNGSVSRFVNLRNLKTLRMEGCNVLSYEWLEDMTWLNDVHIQNQYICVTGGDAQWYANFYGNSGIINYSTFSNLIDAGVLVYTAYQGEAEVLFEVTKDINDYSRIKNGVVYQGKLKDGLDIKNLYKSYEDKTLADWHFNTFFISMGVNRGQTISERKISWSPVNYFITKDTKLVDGKDYFIRDASADSGYSKVEEPIEDDIAIYYEYLDDYHSKAFKCDYSFKVANVSIGLTIKFYVERY